MIEKQVIEDERRLFKRFKVKQESSFVLNSLWPTLGELKDISEGGFSFTYASGDKWSTELAEGCMVFGNHDSCLNNMPVVMVSDYELKAAGQQISPTARRRCVKFGNLSKEQKFLLECFIWINGIAEA